MPIGCYDSAGHEATDHKVVNATDSELRCSRRHLTDCAECARRGQDQRAFIVDGAFAKKASR
jgi:hypothetical protein